MSIHQVGGEASFLPRTTCREPPLREPQGPELVERAGRTTERPVRKPVVRGLLFGRFLFCATFLLNGVKKTPQQVSRDPTLIAFVSPHLDPIAFFGQYSKRHALVSGQYNGVMGPWALTHIGPFYLHRGSGLLIGQGTIDPILESFKVPHLQPTALPTNDPVGIVFGDLSYLVELFPWAGPDICRLYFDSYHLFCPGYSLQGDQADENAYYDDPEQARPAPRIE